MQEFNRLAESIYGYNWRAKVATLFNVNRRTVGRWSTGDSRVPDSVIVALRIIKEKN